MSHGLRRDARSLLSLAFLLSLVCSAACKKSPSARGSGGAGRSHDILVREAISRGAISPRLGQPLSAEVTRIGSAGAFQEPRSVAVDKTGNLYVADTGNVRVVKLDSSGKELLSFGKRGAGPGEFTQPWKVAIAPGGDILVLDRETAWIHVYTANGQFRTSLAGPKMPLYSPGGIAVSPDGTIVMANTGVSNLLLFTPDGLRKGEPITTIAGERIDQPTDASFDAKGTLYVYQTAEQKSPSLLLRHPAARGVESKWLSIDSPSTLDSARLDAGPDGRIYMTDPAMKRILVYSSDGKTCNPIDVKGPEAPPFVRLTGITLDSQGQIYAVDGGANVIYRLRLHAPA